MAQPELVSVSTLVSESPDRSRLDFPHCEALFSVHHVKLLADDGPGNPVTFEDTDQKYMSASGNDQLALSGEHLVSLSLARSDRKWTRR